VDRIPQLAQPFDVASYRSGRDVQAFGEFGARAAAVHLQQRQQPEQAGWVSNIRPR
jgi:hypothetical protein